jgi:hypothetical protein
VGAKAAAIINYSLAYSLLAFQGDAASRHHFGKMEGYDGQHKQGSQVKWSGKTEPHA